MIVFEGRTDESTAVERPLSISILAWFLILNAVRHAGVLSVYQGPIPPDARLWSFVIDGCYMFCGVGLLRMRKWSIPLYFFAHLLTTSRLLQAFPDVESLVDHLASVRLLWFVIAPLAMLAFAVPRWRRMTWSDGQDRYTLGKRARTALKVMVFVVGLGLTLFGAMMILGLALLYAEGTSEDSVASDVAGLLVLGIAPLVGGLFLCRRALRRVSVEQETADTIGEGDR